MREWLARIADWFRRDRLDAELAEELRFHQARLESEARAAGVAPDGAADAARRQLGNTTLAREAARERWSIPWLDHLQNDLRYAVRTLVKAPSFSIAVIVTLGLGIGANAAVFTVVDAVLLRPLPYAEPERLVLLNHTDRRSGITKDFIAIGDYYDLVRQQSAFESIGAYGGFQSSIVTDGEPIPLRVLATHEGAFRAMRPALVLGRGIEADDQRQGAAPVVVLGHEVWVRRYASDPAILGRILRIGTTDRQVVGVAAPGFQFPARAATDAIVPMNLPPQAPPNRRGGWLNVVARLAPDATIESASADLRKLSAQYEKDFPQSNLASEYSAVPLRDALAGNAKTPLLLLLAAVAVLLLIACANVANLVLARALARRQEMSLRVALGAGRKRLAVQVLAESLVLAIAGGAFGVAIAQMGAGAIAALVPRSVGAPGLADVRVNGPVLLFSLAIVCLAALALGLVAALMINRQATRISLAESARVSMSGRARRSASALVVAEVALAIVLLVGAGLILRSFERLIDVNPGFRLEGVAAQGIQLPAGRYQEIRARRAFYDRLVAEVAALPGVRSVGQGVVMPLTGNNWTIALERTDQPLAAGERPPEVGWQLASRGFFDALGIELVSGRLFAASDVPAGPPVVIVSEGIQRRYFGGQDPVGKQVKLGQDTAEIVGVVRDIRRAGLRDEPRADMYLPFEQNPSPNITIFVHTTQDAGRALPAIQQRLRSLEPQLLLLDSTTLEDIASDSVRDTRLMLWLLGLFAGIALTLAAVGIYGVTAYVVRQRTREIGARVALGATPTRILRMVVSDGLALAGLGVAIGIAVTFAAMKLIAAMLFGVSATDPAAMVAAATVMVLVAAAACFIPAMRAARVDPMIALRAD